MFRKRIKHLIGKDEKKQIAEAAADGLARNKDFGSAIVRMVCEGLREKAKKEGPIILYGIRVEAI